MLFTDKWRLKVSTTEETPIYTSALYTTCLYKTLLCMRHYRVKAVLTCKKDGKKPQDVQDLFPPQHIVFCPKSPITLTTESSSQRDKMLTRNFSPKEDHLGCVCCIESLVQSE